MVLCLCDAVPPGAERRRSRTACCSLGGQRETWLSTTDIFAAGFQDTASKVLRRREHRLRVARTSGSPDFRPAGRAQFPRDFLKGVDSTRELPESGSEPLDEPVGHHELGDRRHDMSGIGLEIQAELFFGAHPSYRCAARDATASCTPASGVRASESPLMTSTGRGAISASIDPGVVVAVDAGRTRDRRSGGRTQHRPAHAFIARGASTGGANVLTRACH